MKHRPTLIATAALALALSLAGCSAATSAPASHHAADKAAQQEAPRGWSATPTPTATPTATPADTFGDQFRSFGKFSTATDAEATTNAEAWCKALPVDGFAIVSGIIEEAAGISAAQAQQLLALVAAQFCLAESATVAAG